MFRTITLAAVATVAVAASAWAAEAWQTFRHPEAGFSIEAPADFAFKMDRDVGGLPGKGYLGRDGLVGYVVISANATSMGSQLWTADPVVVAKIVADGAMEGKTVLSQHAVPYPGGGAYEFTFDDEGTAYRIRIVAKRPFILNLMIGVRLGAGADRGLLNGPNPDRFLNSARVIPAS